MKIQEQDIYHGAALTQIVEHKSFKALNRASDKYGQYLINTDRHVFVKYRTTDISPWSFTIQPDEAKAIHGEIEAGHRVFICFVCGSTTICALNSEEFSNLVKLDTETAQWIKIEVPPRSSCRVSGSSGTLRGTIPHNSFPNKVFI